MVFLLQVLWNSVQCFSWFVMTSWYMRIFSKFQRGRTLIQIEESQFPDNVHNYIWCSCYIPSFRNFCRVVSEKLQWHADTWISVNFQVQRGITSIKIEESKIPDNMNNYMMFLLHTKFQEFLLSSFRGVVMISIVLWKDRRTDRRMDRQTDGRSDPSPRTASAFGDAVKNHRKVP